MSRARTILGFLILGAYTATVVFITLGFTLGWGWWVAAVGTLIFAFLSLAIIVASEWVAAVETVGEVTDDELREQLATVKHTLAEGQEIADMNKRFLDGLKDAS